MYSNALLIATHVYRLKNEHVSKEICINKFHSMEINAKSALS